MEDPIAFKMDAWTQFSWILVNKIDQITSYQRFFFKFVKSIILIFIFKIKNVLRIYSISQFLFSLIIYQATFHFTFKQTRWFWITSGNACSTEVKPTSSIFIFSCTGYFWTVFVEDTAWDPFGFISSWYQADTRGQAWITKVCQCSLTVMRNKYIYACAYNGGTINVFNRSHLQ